MPRISSAGIAVTLALLAVLSMVAPAGAALGDAEQPSPDAAGSAGAVTDEAGATAGGGADAGDDGSTSTAGPDLDPGASGGGGPPVDPALENASGEIEVIVRFQEARETPGASANSVSALQNHAQQTQSSFERYARTTEAVEIKQSFWITNAMLVRMNVSEVPPGQLVQFQGIERVHRNFEVEALSAQGENATSPWSLNGGSSSTGEDALANHGSAPNGTWGVEAVNAPETWEAFDTRGGGINVTVLDTGVNASHPDINLSAWAEINSTGGVAQTGVDNAYDPDGHGTHVSGTVAGGNASGEYIGVAPNATLKHGKVLPSGTSSFARILGGMEWATNGTHSDVISMSLGIVDNGYHSEFIDPVQNARSNDILMVVATGNEGEWTSRSPGNIYDSFSIGAVDSNLSVPSFSGGEWIDTSETWDGEAPDSWPERYTVPNVVAPGVNVKSADNATTGYSSLQGTSMAAPHVAGVAALVLAANGSLNDTDVEQTISETASEPHTYEEPDHRYGTGFVDALNATASVTRNATVSGWVTNATSGAGIGNALVETEYGLQTRTNATGYYEFEVPSNNQTITADPLGFEANGTAVNATGQASAQQNITVSTEIPEARLIEGQDRYTNSSAGLNVSYRVANVGNYSMTLLHETAFSSPSGATLRVDGTNQPRNSNITINADAPTTINVSLDPGDGYFGGLVLDHTFYSLDGSTSVTDATGLSRVHDDPVEVPEDVNPQDFASQSLQTPINYVEKNTTIALNDTQSYQEPTTQSPLGTSAEAGIILDHRVSLTGAQGANPVVNFTNNAAGDLDVGVIVTGHDTEISGVTFDGGGANALIYAPNLPYRGVPTGLEIRDAGFQNAYHAVFLTTGTADAVENNTFTNVVNGVYANGGDVRSFANNTGTGILGYGIRLQTSFTNATTIADNDLTLEDGSAAAIRTDGGTDVSSISGNEITLNNDSANGIVTYGGPQSVAPVAVAGNVISGGNVGINADDVDEVRNNTVRDAETGIDVTDVDNAVVVEGNNVTNGTIGITDVESVDSTYRQNTIDNIDNTGLELIGTSSLPITNVTVTNNTITNVAQTSNALAINLIEGSDVSITNTTFSGGEISVYNASSVTTRGNNFSNADAGLVVQGNSADLSFESPTFTNVSVPVFVERNSGFAPTNVTVMDGSVTTAFGTVIFGNVSPAEVDVTNLTLWGGTSVNASGHNSSLAVDTVPSGSSFPANTSGIGHYLNLSAAGPNPAMDVNVSYADGDLTGLREDTLQFYRYNDTAWEPVSSSGVDTATNDVWASTTSFSTFAPLAEHTQANFTVPSIEANASNVLEGDTVQINATIENVGDGNGTQDVALNVSDGIGEVTNTTVSLNTSEQTSISLNWTTGEAGDYNASIVTADDSNSTPVRVDAPTNFSVNVTGTNSPVVEGDSLDVTANVTNLGDRNATQEMNLTIGSTQEDTQPLTVNASESKLVTLNWATSQGDAGDHTATIYSENGSDDATVTVQEPANYTVAIDGTNSPVTEGEELTVDATINNTGDVTGTQDVNLTVGGGEREVASVSLNASENTTRTFSWSTSVGDNGTYTATVYSGNDSDSRSVTVHELPYFAVNVTDTNSPVVEGDDLTVDATINNTGETTATQNVTLDVNGSVGTVVDHQDVNVSANGETSVTFTWANATPAGTYTANVSSANETASTSVTVDEPANFSVAIGGTNSPVVETDTATVNATVTNVGDRNGTKAVNLTIDDGVGEVNTTDVTLDPGNDTQVELAWTPGPRDDGNYTATVASPDGSASTALNVTNVSVYFAVTDLEAPSSVNEGNTIDVTANVTNLGTAANGTQNVTYTFDGTTIATQENVTLNASETAQVTYSHSTGSTGTYTHGVSSANESNTTSITVQSSGGGGGPAPIPPPSDDGPSTNFLLSSFVVSPTEVGTGEGVTVEVRVDNDGEEDGEFTGTLTADGETLDERSVSVNANWHETLTFETTFDEPGTYDLAVNGETAGTVTVAGGANLVITETDVESTSVRAGETVTMTTTVRNDGNSEGSRTVSLEVGGETVDSRTVLLGPGESETVTFEHTFSSAGSHEVTVNGESVSNVEVSETQADDGGDGGDSGDGLLLVLLGIVGVLVAAGSLAVYLYGDEIAELLEE